MERPVFNMTCQSPAQPSILRRFFEAKTPRNVRSGYFSCASIDYNILREQKHFTTFPRGYLIGSFCLSFFSSWQCWFWRDQPNLGKMALLTRYFQLNDTGDTQVFNFVVTKAVTRDFSRDVKSKDFVYRWHRWAISFSREDKERHITKMTAKYLRKYSGTYV